MVKHLYAFILSGEWWLFVVWSLVFLWMLVFWDSGKKKKNSSNSSVPWVSDLFCFPWSIPSSCHFAVASQMFGSFPSQEKPNYCGKTVCFTLKKKKKKRPTFLFIYLDRALCLCLLSPVVGTSVNGLLTTDGDQQPFGSWSHLDKDPLETCQKLAAGQAHLAGWCTRFRELTGLGPNRVHSRALELNDNGTSLFWTSPALERGKRCPLQRMIGRIPWDDVCQILHDSGFFPLFHFLCVLREPLWVRGGTYKICKWRNDWGEFFWREGAKFSYFQSLQSVLLFYHPGWDVLQYNWGSHVFLGASEITFPRWTRGWPQIEPWTLCLEAFCLEVLVSEPTLPWPFLTWRGS